MAIDIPKQIKKQRHLTLILIFGLLILVAVLSIFVLPDIFLRPATVTEAQPITVFKKPQINWQVLDMPELKTLKAFEKITPYEGEIEKENPFLRHLLLLY